MKAWVLRCKLANGKKLYVRNHVDFARFKPIDDITANITKAALFDNTDVFGVLSGGVDGFSKAGYEKTEVIIEEADNGSY